MTKTKGKETLFILGIIFTCACMRGPIASVGSLIPLIEVDLGVSKTALGFITTLPLLVFAFASIFMPKISKSIGLIETLILGLLILCIGTIIRSSGGYTILLLGALLLGLGISSGNVLIPAIIKEMTPTKIGIMTGIYMCSQNLFATMGAGISYPMAVELLIGWRIVLASWGVFALISIIIWKLYLKSKEESINYLEEKNIKKGRPSSLFKSKLGWCITLIMGFQSINYYSITAWLPSILAQSDVSATWAGYLASLFQLLAIPSTFITPMLIANTKSKVKPIVFSGVLYLVGISILMTLNNMGAIVLALFLLASGGGASFSWIIAMIAVVSRDASEATNLSAMSQSIGYLLAAIGPTLAGSLFDYTQSWVSVAGLIGFMSILIMGVGLMTKKYNRL